MDINRLSLDDPRYPAGLKFCLGNDAPKTITAAGDLAVLRPKTLALFCSVKCPGNLVVQTYDLAQKLRAAGVTVIGGFHSPMERECLRILLRSPHPVIICHARGLPERVPPEFRRPLTAGRLLLLSLFADTVRRADEETAHQRNRFVAALADRIFVAYAALNSKTEFFCREISAWGKPLFTLAGTANENLLALGAKPINPKDLGAQSATEAEGLLLEGYQGLEKTIEADASPKRDAAEPLMRLCESWGKSDKADEWRQKHEAFQKGAGGKSAMTRQGPPRDEHAS